MTGTTPTSHITPVKANVRGAIGLNKKPNTPRAVGPPCRSVDASATRHQQKTAEDKNMRRSRCRRTFLISGSYAWDAEGMVGATFIARLDGRARKGVDGPAAVLDGLATVLAKYLKLNLNFIDLI